MSNDDVPVGAATIDAPFADAARVATDIQRRIGVKTVRDDPLARFTTMRVGGPADLLATVHNRFELRALVRFARSRGVPFIVLGRGSDVVIADAGVRGLVIVDRAESSQVEGTTYASDAGVPMARAATETQRAGLTGLEFGLAIPGTVGGAVWANAGAHDADVAAILKSATVLSAEGEEREVPAQDLELSYRHSRLKSRPGSDGTSPTSTGELVLGATFELEAADPDVIKDRLDDIRRWRREHQPIGLPSAGSVFRNPKADSAGRLIEAAGLKGLRIGGAAISEKHANFVINDRKGTASDVRSLVVHARSEVDRRFGIRLELEIVFLGDWSGWRAQSPGS
jgi:UDP-N-acetylmuramate dehydrogenase